MFVKNLSVFTISIKNDNMWLIMRRKIFRKIAISLFFTFLFSFQNLYCEISVQYFGGAGRVSGSNGLLNTDDCSVIIDCGSFYDEGNLQADNSYIPKKIINAKAMILTHAHMDHSGRIPLLISEGFKGKIYCTPATKQILFEVLDDGWNFEYVKQKYFWSSDKMKKIKKYHKGILTLHWYDDCKSNIKDIYKSSKKYSVDQLSKQYKIDCKICKHCLNRYLEELKEQFVEVNYHQNINLSENLSFYLFDAGHIPGSSSVFFNVKDSKHKRTIVVSGDLGSAYSNLLSQKEIAPLADYVFVETTYGGISNDVNLIDYITFQRDIAANLKKGNRVWIPALSLNRTQKVLYEIKEGQNNDIIPINVPVFSLSPSSNGITSLYENEIKNPSEQKWFNDSVYQGKTILPQNYTENRPKEFPIPSIIISASGMMDQGVSYGLLNKLLPFENTSVFLVSYVSPLTPAGKLKNNAKTIKTKYGQVIDVKAQTNVYNIFSDHPDSQELLHWLSNQDKNNSSIFLVHGELKILEKCQKFYKQQGYNKVKIANFEKILIN